MLILNKLLIYGANNLVPNILINDCTKVILQQSIRGYKHHKDKFPHILTPELKKIRYSPTWHNIKLMHWNDYQFRVWRGNHRNKKKPVLHAKLDFSENLIRLGMSDWAIKEITNINPWALTFVRRKVTGNIVCPKKGVWRRP